MNLADIIAALRAADPDACVVIDDTGRSPGPFTSYRGYYDELAIVPVASTPVRAGEFLARAERAVGAEFTGYKGGTYTMSGATRVWVSEVREASEVQVTDVICGPEIVRLLTQDLNTGPLLDLEPAY